MWPAGPGDNQARFLADLRALRDEAAIGYDELAARAHYPSDVLKEAENGPFLPGLPVLTAYVRACEGNVLDWEERWRRLAEVPEDPELPVRPAGASPAAAAGARAGVSVAPPDVYDPERIRAALRGGHGRSDHGGRGTGDPGISVPARSSEFLDRSPAGWDADPSQDTNGRQDTGANPGNLDTDGSPEAGSARNSASWDVAAEQPVTMANGNHPGQHHSRGPFDPATVKMPDSDEHAEQTDQFRWLPDSQQEPQPDDSEFSWSGQADNGQATAPPDLDATPAAGPWTPQRHDDVHQPAERTDFWAPSVTAASADLQLPAAPPRRTEEHKLTQASSAAAFTESAETLSVRGTSELAQEFASSPGPSAGSAASVGSARSMASTGSATAQATSAEPARHEKDRFFPARLLIIIIIAALIGSALVLLLH